MVCLGHKGRLWIHATSKAADPDDIAALEERLGTSWHQLLLVDLLASRDVSLGESMCVIDKSAP